jgi:hypothetical protein
MLNGVVLAVIVAFLPATALAMTEGYIRGYNDGTRDYSGKGWDASCPIGHSAAYCLNYQEGYKHAWSQAQGRGGSGGGPGTALSTQQLPGMQQNNSTNNGSGQALEQNASNQQAPQQNIPINGSEGGGQSTTTSGNTAWQEFGLFLGPIQRHTGVYHNQNCVFIPWTTLCKAGQSYLNETCDSLINPDGSLTSEGNRAVGCITNGAIVTVIGSTFNMPLSTIKGLLGYLAPVTGCGGIVNLDQIQTSPDLQRLAQFAASSAH